MFLQQNIFCAKVTSFLEIKNKITFANKKNLTFKLLNLKNFLKVLSVSLLARVVAVSPYIL